MLKRRMLGTIRLIGELYKRKIMQYWIMKYCLQTLIKGDDPVEENIESLCKLLTTVGKAMEQERHKDNQEKEIEFLKFVFARLQALSVDKRLSSRIRFMIQDILDLKKKGWKPRKVEATAKKIGDINKEAESEKRRRDAEDKERARNSRMPSSRGMQVEREKDVFKPQRGKDRYGTRTKTPTKTPSATDGWATASRGKQKGGRGAKESPRSSTRTIDTRPAASTPKSNKNQQRGNNFRKDKEKSAPKPKKSGFAALCDDSDDENDADSANDSGNESEKSGNESASANESASDSETETTSSKKRDSNVSKMSRDEAKVKIKSFFLEYFNLLDKDEVKMCIQDLGSKEFNQEIVTMGLELAIDGKPPYRQHLPGLFLYLHEERILSTDNFILGLGDILSCLADMLCDMPNATKYLAAILTPLILAEIIPFNYLLGSADVEAFEMGSERAKMVEFIVLEVAQTKGVDYLKTMDIRNLHKVAKDRSSLVQWLKHEGV